MLRKRRQYQDARAAHPARSKPGFPNAPAGDEAFASLADSRMYWPVQRARLQVSVRDAFQAGVGRPLESALMAMWQRRMPGGSRIEAKGLPRRAVERALGDQLVVSVDPGQLIRLRDWRGCRKQERPSSNIFIWGGDWDLRRSDFRDSGRIRFVRDIDMHRHQLEKSEAYRRFESLLQAGVPWRSHQQGVLLDTEERILQYLKAYLGFLDHMAEHGFDKERGKDELSVAVTRDGRLLKLNRGLHRLAMAQHLKLASIPVTVKAVHREWWDRVTGDAIGQKALARVVAALAECEPETDPGSLDPRAA